MPALMGWLSKIRMLGSHTACLWPHKTHTSDREGHRTWLSWTLSPGLPCLTELCFAVSLFSLDMRIIYDETTLLSLHNPHEPAALYNPDPVLVAWGSQMNAERIILSESLTGATLQYPCFTSRSTTLKGLNNVYHRQFQLSFRATSYARNFLQQKLHETLKKYSCSSSIYLLIFMESCIYPSWKIGFSCAKEIPL